MNGEPIGKKFIDLGWRSSCSVCGGRYCICVERQNGTWENDLPIKYYSVDADLVQEAKQYNQQLNGRIERIEKAVCKIAQAVIESYKIRPSFERNSTRFMRAITIPTIDALTNIVADLTPLPKKCNNYTKLELPDNGCNDPPEREYGDDG